MDSRIESRRYTVDLLLKQCTDEKQVRGRTDVALSKANEALELAKQAPSLPSPWPQLAAYRKAHLLLRASKSDHRLEEIDALFKEASWINPTNKNCPLGPLPCIYRLTVMHRRLVLAKNERDGTALRNRILEAFEVARREVQHRLGPQFPHVDDGRTVTNTGPIQEGLFNMLELAAYFLGESYAPLDGVGGLDVNNRGPDNAWCLVGADPEIATVKFARELALEELEARASECPKGVFFQFPTRESPPVWRLAGGAWEQPPSDSVKLLAIMLKEPSTSRTELRRKLGDISQEYLRQIIQRTKHALRAITGRKDLTVFETNSDPLTLTGELTILGAVHNRSIR